MLVRQVRLSNRAKQQLARLKGKTGIQNWNVLCRWALCLSLADPTPPPDVDIVLDSNVEMSWYVFGGEYHELYTALLIQRCLDEGLEVTPANISKLLRLHLHRGIAYLSTTNFISSIEDLLSLVASGGRESQHEQVG